MSMKKPILILTALLGFAACAASMEHVALEVEDPASMAKWWTENLGFKVTLSRPAGSTFIEDEAGRVAFELYRPQDGRKAPDYRNMPILQLHFGLFSDDVEADAKRLVAAGATEVAKDEAPGLKGVTLRDPNGLAFQVMQREKPVVSDAPRKAWTTEGFEAFRRGTFGNAGQNLYVSRAGVLQRIYQYDLDRNGFFDLVFANCQNHHESAPSYIYSLDGRRVATLPAQGARSGLVVDLDGDGVQDVVIAGYWNLLVPFPAADVYYGQPSGDYGERCRIRLQAPRATDCACGRFDAGKTSLAFAMPHFGIVRICPQSEIGFEWTKFTDLKIDADLVAAGDFDGDGFDDLACRKEKSTATTVLWGGEKGLDTARMTEVPEAPADELAGPAMKEGFESELEEKFPAVRLLETVEWNGGKCFTLMTGRKCVFFKADGARRISRALELPAPMGISATTGDFNADGLVDVAIASHVRDPLDGSFQNSWIWLNSADGFKDGNRIAVRTQSASSVHAMDGMVVFGQCAANGLYTNDALLFSFDGGRFDPVPRRFEGEDARRVRLFRDACGEARLFVQNHFARRCDGYDKTYVYWGRSGGYDQDDMTAVPSWCAVDAVTADLDDDGWVEMVVCNNSENSLDKDPGHHVHHFGPNGFDPSKSYTLKTDIGWGAMVADFNRDGYLDVFTVCDHWNALAMFEGGPDGLKRTYDCVLFPPTGEDLDGASRPANSLKRMNIGALRWPVAVDLNGDGWLDVAVPVCKDRSYVLWGSPEGFDPGRRQDFAAYMCTGARTADLDKNGWPDLIFGGHVRWASGLVPDSQPHSSFVNIYWNGPDGLSESRKCILRADAASNMCAGDFNGDGWLDLFAGSYQSEVNRDICSFIYWNRKGGFAIADRQDLVTHSVSGCIAADFNQDGRVDLAVANHKLFGDHTGYSEVWWNGDEGFLPSRTTKLPTCGPHGMSAIEPGNQLTRGPEEYYYSEPYRADEDMVVRSADVAAECPPKTWVRILTRSAPTREALEGAEWREPVGQKVVKGGYLQYRLELGATLSLSTPRVTSVCIRFAKGQ
jgi:hypothetical protein